MVIKRPTLHGRAGSLMVSAVAVVTAACWPGRAVAQTAAGFNPHDAQPERPTVATHAYGVAPGYVELEAGLQRIQMLLVHHVFDQIVARPFLPVHQFLHQLVPGEGIHHHSQAILDGGVGLGFVLVGHGGAIVASEPAASGLDHRQTPAGGA